MRTLAANHTTENDKISNKPVVEVEFTGITEKYSSGTFSSFSVDHYKYISNFSYVWPSFNLLTGFQSNAQLSFTLTDKSQAVTNVLQAASFFEKTVTAKIGDQNIVIGDFFTLPTLKIRNMKIDNNFQSWGFTCRGVFELLKGDIFRSIPTTDLSADYLIGSTATIGMDDFTGFIDPANLPSKIGAQAYIKIDNEIIKYEALTATEPSTITRAQFGTKDTDHFDGAEVQQFFAFPGVYPTDWILYVLLTTSDGSGHAYYDLASFDSAFNDFGLGLSASEVPINDIERMGYKWFFDTEACYYVGSYKTKNAKSWLGENLLKPGNMFFYVDADNKMNLGIVDLHQFSDTTAVTDSYNRGGNDTGVTITNSKNTSLTGYEVDMDSMINEVHVTYAINPLGSDSGTLVKLEYDTSKLTHGPQEKPKEVSSPLIGGSGINDAKIAWETVRRLFYFYGEPLIKLSAAIDPRKWLFEAYDTFTLENAEIPDIENGGKGISNKFMVLGHALTPIGQRKNVYNLISPEPYNLTNNPATTFTVITEGSLDDTAVSFNSPADLVVDALDGNHDFGSDILMGLVYFDIKITPPAAGSTDHWISLRFKQFNSASIIIGTVTDKEKILRYNSGDSTAFTVRIIKIINSASMATPAIAVRKVAVQWFEASAGGSERPSAVEFVEFGYIAGSLGSFSLV